MGKGTGIWSASAQAVTRHGVWGYCLTEGQAGVPKVRLPPHKSQLPSQSIHASGTLSLSTYLPTQLLSINLSKAYLSAQPTDYVCVNLSSLKERVCGTLSAYLLTACVSTYQGLSHRSCKGWGESARFCHRALPGPWAVVRGLVVP